jgi:hypothetical protein
MRPRSSESAADFASCALCLLNPSSAGRPICIYRSRSERTIVRNLEGCSFTPSAIRYATRILATWPRPYLQSVYDQSSFVKCLTWEFRKKKWPLKLGIMSTISADEIVDLIASIRIRHHEVESD